MRIDARMLRQPVPISSGHRSMDGRGDMGTLRVASVPENHVYVRHIGVPGDDVIRLADPVPAQTTQSDVWWPPRMLDPEWIRENAHAFDVFHLHFGFDAKSPADLAAVVATLRALGKPFVYTVHDLRNPHHAKPELHDRHLDVLVPAADALITLTVGAANEIAARWGRNAMVLPHPHVVDEPWRSVPRPSTGKFIVGVHAKSVRANMAPGPVVRALRPIVQSIPNGLLRVDVHTEVLAPGSPNYHPGLVSELREMEGDRAVDLRVHDCFTDADLWRYFLELDVSVLPYRFGTHSGWLEACHDLGTTVVAPDVGYFAEQRPCLTYRLTNDGPDRVSLRDAIRCAFDMQPIRADPGLRDCERAAVARGHRSLYEGLLARSSTSLAR
jgi:glycosyltransferase involved in cell wall biosynthesis